MALFKINYYSTILGHDTDINVIVPDEKHIQDFTPKEQFYDVIYLLHGMGDDSSGWVRYSNVERYANEFNFMIVMPNGEHSFYTNAIHEKQWGDYFSKELPYHLKKWFPISENQYISGLSMGGYGAFKLGFEDLTRFKGISGLSSVLSLVTFKNVAPKEVQATIDQIFCTIYDTKTPQADIQKLAKNIGKHYETHDYPLILQFNGTEDFLYEDNQTLRDILESTNIPYFYEEWSGGHDWNFWDTAIYKTLKYFRNGVN